MGIQARLKTIDMRQLYKEDLSPAYKYFQIAIDGATADPIINSPEIQVDLIRAGMVAARLDCIQNQLTLSCIPPLFHQNPLLPGITDLDCTG